MKFLAFPGELGLLSAPTRRAAGCAQPPVPAVGPPGPGRFWGMPAAARLALQVRAAISQGCAVALARFRPEACCQVEKQKPAASDGSVLAGYRV